MTAEPPALTATSHAVLALLALREGGAYEVTARMESGLRFYWPRARSKLYEEPKKLVAHGLAKAGEQTTGKRRRVVYRITPKGRRVLAQWLSHPGGGPVLEFEALLKLAFGDLGTIEGFKNNVQAILDEARAVRELGRKLASAMLRGRPAEAERLHVSVLVWHFLDGWAEQRERWAAFALDWVSTWDTTEATPERLANARKWFEQALAQDPDQPPP